MDQINISGNIFKDIFQLFINNNIYKLKGVERIDMNNDKDEIQYYKQIIRNLIDNINDLNILQKIVVFIQNISKWRLD